LFGRLLHPPRQGVIHTGRKKQKKEEEIAGLVVEIQTDQEQVGIPQGHTALNQCKTDQNNRKIGPEKETNEVQRLGRVKQQMGQEFTHG
jgi:hypothetical protein